MEIYLSAPLFTQEQRRWNRLVARGLEKRIAGARVVLPQDYRVHSSFNKRTDFPHLFRSCVEGAREADLMVAVLDGPDVDSGTAFEMGIAYERDIPIVGIRTDYRESQQKGVNLMISGACTVLLREMAFGEDVEQLLKDLADKVVHALKRTGRRAPPGEET
ncbi:MAG: nucleoside 2-deoxyribosyltransferase [Candidatus Brocadiaceae bacterium]|nr:nucleoside 2-deoxyribosyltransferase [Candidatus Brocadiaceae bacterium]